MGACLSRFCEPLTGRSHDSLTTCVTDAALNPTPDTPPASPQSTPRQGLLQNGKPSEDDDGDDDGYESAKSDFSTCTWTSERSVESSRGTPSPRLATLATPQPTAPTDVGTTRGAGGSPRDHENDAHTPDAWRALSEATAHLEDDALDRLEGESGGGSKTKKRGGVATRLAKVAAGMRMLRAVGRAIYAAGGSLDLTNFAGTPIRWHTPMSTLRTHHRAESTLRKTNGERRLSRAHRMFTQTHRDFGRAWDTVRLSICDSDNEEDVGDDRAIDRETRGVFPDAASPEGRLLRVVRCVVADVDCPGHLQKPFNPILGETARHELRLVGGCRVRSIIEQVSHHPPVSAFHCVGDGWTVRGHFQPQPRLRGMGGVEVDMLGRRIWETGPPNRRGMYVSDFVGFVWKFLPRMKTKIAGTWSVSCRQTGLGAEVTHGSKKSLKGRVFDVTEPSETLFEIFGAYDSRVLVTDVTTNETHVLFDADEAAAAEDAYCESDCAFELEGDDRSSERVWGPVIDAMNTCEWDKARVLKREVEERERRERRRRKETGEPPRRPRYFEWSDVDGTWELRRDIGEPRGAPSSLGQ